jgi:hypothetical protein
MRINSEADRISIGEWEVFRAVKNSLGRRDML